MKRSLVFFSLLLAACQTPPSMVYQRSEYKVQRVGGLVVSSSPRYSRQEFLTTPTHIIIEESWIAQNVDTKPVEILLSKGMAAIKDKSYPLSCSENRDSSSLITIAPGEKAVIRCTWLFPKQPPTRSDLWVTFSVPTSSGESISSNKIVRAEDFR